MVDPRRGQRQRLADCEASENVNPKSAARLATLAGKNSGSIKRVVPSGASATTVGV